MPKIIIGIHGLGNKPARELLEKWWLAAICEGLKKTGLNNISPDFEMIYWADIPYPKPLDPAIVDRNDPLFLEEKYTAARRNYKPADHKLRKRVVDFIKTEMEKIFLNKDFTINYSFIPHAILHRFFRDLETYYSDDFTENETPPGAVKSSVREKIRQRAFDILKKHENDEILLIGHSMGSIIIYDVLTLMLPAIKIHTLVTIGSPLGLPVAKSKIAAGNKNVLIDSGKLTTPPGVERWYNYADIEDFVAINYDLADDFHPNDSGITVKDFMVHNDYEIEGRKNPHKSYGYLRTPELSSVIAGFLKEERRIPGRNILKKAKKMLEFLQRRKRLRPGNHPHR
jgi:hypothetical protein